MLFRKCTPLLKKANKIPPGMSKFKYFKQIANPKASKPWNQKPLAHSVSEVDITSPLTEQGPRAVNLPPRRKGIITTSQEQQQQQQQQQSFPSLPLNMPGDFEEQQHSNASSTNTPQKRSGGGGRAMLFPWDRRNSSSSSNSSSTVGALRGSEPSSSFDHHHHHHQGASDDDEEARLAKHFGVAEVLDGEEEEESGGGGDDGEMMMMMPSGGVPIVQRAAYPDPVTAGGGGGLNSSDATSPEAAAAGFYEIPSSPVKYDDTSSISGYQGEEFGDGEDHHLVSAGGGSFSHHLASHSSSLSSSPDSVYTSNSGTLPGYLRPDYAPLQDKILGTTVTAPSPQEPLASAQFSDGMKMDFTRVTHFHQDQHLNLLKDTRSKRQVAETTLIPQHLNKLFYKIMKWNSELATSAGGVGANDGSDNNGDDDDDASPIDSDGLLKASHLDNSTGFISRPVNESSSGTDSSYESSSNALPPFLKQPPVASKDELAERGWAGTALLTKEKEEEAAGKRGASSSTPDEKFQVMQNKLKYGALMKEFDNDQFALKHKLKLGGKYFEKKWRQWEGVSLLENKVGEELEAVRDNKSSIIVHGHPDFKIPKEGRDPCPGCGATMQSQDEGEFGYITPTGVSEYIQKFNEALKYRSEYADRMHELSRHWEKHGKRVGEEWLDFMTQEEFDSIYYWQNEPMVCMRCSQLSNYGPEHSAKIAGAKYLLPAKDFSEELRALKEKRCVIVLVIDLNDFPGSMIMDLPGLISMNNPVIIAANKLDLIQQRDFGWSGDDVTIRRTQLTPAHVINWVRDLATEFGLPNSQIKRVVPVSATTGWGVMNLIDAIDRYSNLTLRSKENPIPTYFVGVCNVGKSRLINKIAQMSERPDPPTPTAKKIYWLQADENGNEIVKSSWDNVRSQELWSENPVVRRDKGTDHKLQLRKRARNLTVSSLPGTTVKVVAVKVSDRGANSKQTFFYDTPGLYPHWYQGSILTTKQIGKCLGRRYTKFNGRLLHEGETIFLSAMAAIDVVKAPKRGLFFCTYHRQPEVSLMHVVTDQSEEFWSEHNVKMHPPGSPAQLGDLRLTVKKTYLFECFAKHQKNPKADIYFCGLGWISFFCSEPSDVVIKVRTIPGVVHGIREPLRHKDMKPFAPWPKLPAYLRLRRSGSRKSKKLDTVIKLTAGPVDPTSEPLKLVKPVEKLVQSQGSSAPFDYVKSLLVNAGKMKETASASSKSLASSSSSESESLEEV